MSMPCPSPKNTASVSGRNQERLFIRNRRATADLNLSAFRRSAENLVIQRTKQEALEKKLKLRREFLKQEVERRFATISQRREDNRELKKDIYSKILEFEQENAWAKTVRKNLRENSHNIEVIRTAVNTILRCKMHPLGKLLAESQYKIYTMTAPIVKDFSPPVFSFEDPPVNNDATDALSASGETRHGSDSEINEVPNTEDESYRPHSSDDTEHAANKNVNENNKEHVEERRDDNSRTHKNNLSNELKSDEETSEITTLPPSKDVENVETDNQESVVQTIVVPQHFQPSLHSNKQKLSFRTDSFEKAYLDLEEFMLDNDSEFMENSDNELDQPKSGSESCLGTPSVMDLGINGNDNVFSEGSDAPNVRNVIIEDSDLAKPGNGSEEETKDVLQSIPSTSIARKDIYSEDLDQSSEKDSNVSQLSCIGNKLLKTTDQPHCNTKDSNNRFSDPEIDSMPSTLNVTSIEEVSDREEENCGIYQKEAEKSCESNPDVSLIDSDANTSTKAKESCGVNTLLPDTERNKGTSVVSSEGKTTSNISMKTVHDIGREIHVVLDLLHSLLLITYTELDEPNAHDVTFTVLEAIFFNPVWPWLYLLFRKCNEEKEWLLYHVMKVKHSVGLDDFGVRKKFQLLEEKGEETVAAPFSDAIEELSSLTGYTSPFEKLECAVRASRKIVDNVEEYYTRVKQTKAPVLGCDDLLPILTYVIIKTGQPQLVSECHALEEFINECYLMGEEGYCLTTVQTAISYLIVQFKKSEEISSNVMR